MSALRVRELLLTGLLAATGSVEGAAGELIDDAALTARVKAALIDDEAAKSREIDVKTRDGVVQLSGFVESEESRRTAEEVARSVEGVSEVRNALIVRAGERTVGAVVDDSIIEAKVKAQLADEAGLESAAAVNVEVHAGVVQLSGFVESDDQKARAGKAASGVDGVAQVRNDIEVRR
jgi:hyperosmotically inducible protein